ncbi:BrnT family toxin [Francisella philomiragia]|uniref:Uncharacterized protein n=1 Tax=Francisella philomiragia subsp. philomiragia (strain ATCC 25017 / CCUG 19701 / FSC 153 / O\|nr:BrnT family toxin [Francisella philomiragia]AJI46871.1 hypothetical protein BF30_1047 [Francisella philomiragia]AJI49420.1 hypothetical protein KU46_508 [Francisella philomiragia]MBK2021131.1 BrnT family toxin [Francisella philomiragia]MBK2030942.1 BrnT family toxin [Francisella philomiragia]MBK2264472.1 BrnT family toxin [Francisella philomiragia]
MFLWDDSKNETLIDTRGISFDEIVSAIELDINPLDIYENKNYKNQYKMDVLIGDYVWVVVFEIRNGDYWLVTAFKNRKANKKHKRS